MRLPPLRSPWRGRTFAVLAAICVAAALTAAAPADAASYPVAVTHQKMDDPGVMLYNGNFYALRTGDDLKETSTVNAGGPWSTAADVLDPTNVPAWVGLTQIWDPDITSISPTRFVVYFAATVRGGDGGRCIGAAVSSSPTGPFTIVSQQPLVCMQIRGQDDMAADPGHRPSGTVGVIGVSPVFVTINGQRNLYLLYKTQGTPATIRMVELSTADGTTVLGDSHELVYSTDGVTIESPSLIQVNGYFVLFDAHGPWDKCSYSTIWYKSQDIWHWNNSGATTLLSQSSTNGLCGPGTGDVTDSKIAGQYRFFFNGWTVKNSSGDGTDTPATAQDISNNNAVRVLYVAILTFSSTGTPSIAGYIKPGS